MQNLNEVVTNQPQGTRYRVYRKETLVFETFSYEEAQKYYDANSNEGEGWKVVSETMPQSKYNEGIGKQSICS